MCSSHPNLHPSQVRDADLQLLKRMAFGDVEERPARPPRNSDFTWLSTQFPKTLKFSKMVEICLTSKESKEALWFSQGVSERITHEEIAFFVGFLYPVIAQYSGTFFTYISTRPSGGEGARQNQKKCEFCQTKFNVVSSQLFFFLQVCLIDQKDFWFF